MTEQPEEEKMMNNSPLIDTDRIKKLQSRISHKVQTSCDRILPFADFTDFLTDLLRVADSGHSCLHVGGLATAETALAVDRAGLTLNEISGPSPFSGDPDRIARELNNSGDIILLTNPNRLTGANFGLADLEILAQCVPDGLLIIDEHYFDFYGITGVKLLDKHKNIAILRSLTGAFGINSDQSGFVVSSPEWIERLKQFHDWDKISFTLYKILITSLSSSDVLSVRLKCLHDESLRISRRLSKLKIQSRLSATDFIMMRVADPSQVVKFLASDKVETRLFEGYAGLENYVSYKIQSPLTNDNFLQAFRRMPEAHYRMQSVSRQALQLKRGAETAEQKPEVVTRDHIEILKNEKEETVA